MTAHQEKALRARSYTYYEMLSFALYYHEFRNEDSPDNLLVSYLGWPKDDIKKLGVNTVLFLIEKTVAGFYNISLQDIRGKRRYSELVKVRQIIAYLSVRFATPKKGSVALPIKRCMIYYGQKKCADLMEVEPQLRNEVKEIERLLNIAIEEALKLEVKEESIKLESALASIPNEN